MSADAMIRACPCCGLVQQVPRVPSGARAVCARCESSLVRSSIIARSRSRTAAAAVGALVLFPLGISLPIMEIERFGHAKDASILEGVTTLLSRGHWFVGGVVLLCSIVFPLAKLGALLTLSVGGGRLRGRHRALTYRFVEWTGRWGMLDVLLIAVLVAVVKLGDLVDVTPGPAAIAFALCVILSLAASACFDPHALWNAKENGATDEPA